MSKYKLSGKVFDAVAVEVGTPVNSEVQEMKSVGYDGFGSLQIVDQVSVGTTGTLAVHIETSNDGTNFSIPKDNAGADKNTVVIATHEDGTELYQFPEVPIANYYRYVLTASTANITSISGFQSAK